MRYAILGLFAALCFVAINPASGSRPDDTANTKKDTAGLQLGNFSVSLNVKDLKASKEFYEKPAFNCRVAT